MFCPEWLCFASHDIVTECIATRSTECEESHSLLLTTKVRTNLRTSYKVLWKASYKAWHIPDLCRCVTLFGGLSGPTWPTVFALEYDCTVILKFGHAVIRGAFHDNFPGFSGFGFRRKLARTKTQQGTQTKRANSIFAGFGPAYARINRSGVNFVSNHLSSIHYTSSQFLPTSLFASASVSAPARERCHRQSTPPPLTEYAVPSVRRRSSCWWK